MDMPIFLTSLLLVRRSSATYHSCTSTIRKTLAFSRKYESNVTTSTGATKVARVPLSGMRYNSKWEPWRDDPVAVSGAAPSSIPQIRYNSVELDPYIYKSHVTYIVRALFGGDTDQLRIQK